MAKPVRRKCPACGKDREYRSDQKTCGCRGRSCVVDSVPLSARETFLRKENKRLRAQVESLQEATGFREELLDTIRTGIEALEPLPPIPYKSVGRSETGMAAVLKLSDWHIGARIRPEETEGFGRYDWAVARKRAFYIAHKFLGAVETYRQSFNIPELYIFGEADWVSGDIHDELRRTNEFPLPVQAVKAGELLAGVVSVLAPHFHRIYIVEVGADNHGRLQPKPQFKQKSQNSMSYVTYSVANALLAKHGNVQPMLSEGIQELVGVVGQNFLVAHGDVIKSWMGVPYYGIERYRGKEASKRIQAMLDKKRKDTFTKRQKDVGFDFLSYGHWHVPAIVSGNILINGSLTGTDEFDHACGRHAKPSQVSFLVHPKYGIFNWTAWTVRD